MSEQRASDDQGRASDERRALWGGSTSYELTVVDSSVAGDGNVGTGPRTIFLQSCQVCGALIAGQDLDVHAHWHQGSRDT